jgi:hypothetical protein
MSSPARVYPATLGPDARWSELERTRRFGIPSWLTDDTFTLEQAAA